MFVNRLSNKINDWRKYKIEKKRSILFPYKKVLRIQEDILAMHKKVENPLAHPFTLRGSRLSFLQNIKDV